MSRLSLLMPLLLGAAACHNVGGVTSDADGDGYDFRTDCDDTNALVHPGADELCNELDDDCDGEIDEEAVDAPGWHVDNDADGYGDPEGAVESCVSIEGLLEDGTDCDDTDATIYPGAIEVWYDGVDTDCDGWSDYDSDRDGHDSDAWGGDDCDDTEETIHPDAVETWYDGVDADCAGDDDYDQDHDGFDLSTDCDDTDALVYPGAIEIWYDGLDTDCDGWSDYDQDRDGFDASAWGGDDCEDLDAAVNPSAEDVPYDGLDTDCDGWSDYDADRDGHDSDAWHGADCDDADATIYPGAPETWYDGIDSDCAADDDFDQDVDGYDLGPDCDDVDATVNPGATDTWYDGVDQDCGGNSDYDADYDGHDSDAYAGDDCDDADGTISPSAEELCDLLDNDCDGVVDEGDAADAPTWYTDGDGDGWGDPASGATACSQPSGTIADGSDCDDLDALMNQDDADTDGFSTCDGDCDDTVATTYPGADEVAANGVDDDCDGEIDNDAELWLVTTPGDFELGGQDGNGLLTLNDDGEVSLARLVTGIGSAASTTSLPYALSSMGVVATGGYLYAVGGSVSSYYSSYSSAAHSAAIGTSGALGAWNSSISALPTGTTVAAFMTDGHCLVFAGGMTSSDSTAEEVYTAELNGDGTISSWSAQASLSSGVSYAVGAALRGYVYVIGGEVSGSYYNTTTATVQYARLDPDCTIDSWSSTTSLPSAREYAGVALAGGSIYVVGGYDSSGNTSASVYRASPGITGTISSWSTEASLPASRARPGVAVLDGYLIAAGGEDSSGNLADEIYYSAIASSDSLGTWGTSSTYLPDGTYNHRLASWQGHIYRVGGYVDSYYYATRTDTVDYLTASHSSATSARQTAVAYTFDLGSSAELVRLAWALTTGSDGTAAVWYRSASTTGNAGSWTSLGSSSPGTLSGTGRYVDVYVLLSSSTGDASTLDEIELAYRP